MGAIYAEDLLFGLPTIISLSFGKSTLPFFWKITFLSFNPCDLRWADSILNFSNTCDTDIPI